jgi:hypothetical protein
MSTIHEIIVDAFDMFDEPITSIGKYNQNNLTLTTRLANRIYVEVCKETLCSLEEQTITTVNGTRLYPLPINFVAVKKIIYNDIPLDNIYENEAVLSGGEPTEYFLVLDKYIGINPKPDQTYTLTLSYFNKPINQLTVYDIPSLVPNDYHYVISEGIVAQLMKYDKGDLSNGFIKWQGIYKSSLEKMAAYFKTGTNADAFYNVM